MGFFYAIKKRPEGPSKILSLQIFPQAYPQQSDRLKSPQLYHHLHQSHTLFLPSVLLDVLQDYDRWQIGSILSILLLRHGCVQDFFVLRQVSQCRKAYLAPYRLYDFVEIEYLQRQHSLVLIV